MASPRRGSRLKQQQDRRHYCVWIERLEERRVLNAAPTIDTSASPVLGLVQPNAAPPVVGSTVGSVLVSSVIDASGPLSNYSDADGDLPGIAITGLNLNGGRLWSTIDAGVSWQEITVAHDTFATLLYADASTRLYFAPANGFTGSLDDVISFRAWDRTGGFANGTTGINTQFADTHVGQFNTREAIDVTLSSDGRYAYFADGYAGLQIIDVRSDPTNPTRVGGFDTSGRVTGVAISSDGRYAYIADYTAGFQIIDVQDPANPTYAGGFDTSGEARGVTLSSDGRYAYVADGLHGLQIIDVQDPANPTYVGGYDTGGYHTSGASRVTLSYDGRYAYVADASGLQIIDVQDPANPTYAGGFDTSGAARGVTLSSDGRYAYVADSGAGLEIIDVQNPSNPTRVGGFDPGDGAWDVTLSSDGRYAYVASGLYGLQIVNVQDPTNPTRAVPEFEIQGTAMAVTLSADGRYAFVADGFAGLQIIDVQNLANSPRVGGFDTRGGLDGNGMARGVTLSSDGRYAFVADGYAGLQIIDVQNPASPTYHGGLDTFGYAESVTLSFDGRYAFVADHSAGLQIIDVKNPANPTYVGGLDTFGYASSVTLSADGRYAFVADGWETYLHVIDVQDPANPTRVGGFEPGGSSSAVKLSSNGHYAYVTDFAGALQILDVQNPVNPTRVGGFAMGESSDGLALSSDGRYAYVTNGSAGLQIIDVQNPANPTRVGRFATVGYPYSVTLSSDGRYAYVTGERFLQIIDVQDPANPTRVGGAATSGEPSVFALGSDGVTLSPDGRYAFVADGLSGLQIIDATIGRPPFSLTTDTVAIEWNRRPTDIILSRALIFENPPTGTTVGTLAGVDPDSGDTFTFSLAAGTGDTDNSSFRIDGSTLKTAAFLDGQAGATRSIRVRVTDSGGLSFERAFTITVTNGTNQPVLDPTAFPVLALVQPNAAPPAAGSTAGSTLVSSLIDASGPLSNYSDANGDLPGIAITGLNLNGGRLWLTIDAGASWQEITDANDTFATLLYADASTRLYFAPANGFTGSLDDVISFRAWDRTGGFANGTTGVNTQIADWLVGGFDTSGEARGVTLSSDGRYAFVADGFAGLQIIDVQNPANPTYMGGFDTSDFAWDVTLSSDGRYAYVADYGAGLKIIDVQNPAKPTRIGGFDTPGGALGVTLSSDGRYAYVADWDIGLRIINVQDPTNPSYVGGFVTSDSAWDVTLSSDGRYAYVADRDAGLQIIDVQDPANPTRVGGFDTPGNAIGVTLSSDGRYAYVADGLHGLQIIDVQDPASPSYVGGFVTPGGAHNVTLSSDGRYAYLADDFAGLQIIDVQNPANPTFVDWFDTSGYAWDVTLSSDGRHAFVADDTSGLQIIDLQGAVSPTRVGGFDTSGETESVTLSSDGRYAYVTDGIAGLEIIDVQDPTNPTRAGGFDTNGEAYQVTLSYDGRYAYVADWVAGLQIIDVQNPAKPNRVGGFVTNGYVYGVTLSSDGRYAYIADYTAGFQIIDVQNPGDTTRVGGFDTPGNAIGVTLSFDGRYAFVADGAAGLQIIDVQNPANPTYVGGVDTNGYAQGVTLSSDGRYAFVADDYSGLQIIDVQNPANPTRVNELFRSGSAQGVTLSSDSRYAFVADGYSGLQIIDVQNPANPTYVGGFVTPGGSRGVTLSSDGRYAFVADGFAGLQIIDTNIIRSPFSLTTDTVAIEWNRRPTDIILSRALIFENPPTGTTVGTLAGVDPDSGDTFTFSLAAGTGDTDNSSFRIDGSTLKTAAFLDGQAGATRSIRVRVTDSGGLSFERAFTITVTNGTNQPVLDPTAFPVLALVQPNAAPPAAGSTAGSTLVSSLIDASGPLSNYSDANGDLPGIAITGLNLNGGRLWLTIDAGASWQEITDANDTFATLLYADASTRLYFAPANGFTGSLDDVISFRAWDRTGGFANGTTGVNTQTFDPTNPTRVGGFDTSGSAFAVTLSSDGRHAYIADGNTLQIIDVQDPANPSRVGGFEPSVVANDVTLSSDGRHAYIADYTAGFQIIDVQDPANPTRVGGFDTSGTVQFLMLSSDDRYAYVADDSAGLQIFDVQNPANPTHVGGFVTPGGAQHVTLSSDGRYAYVANYIAGLQIIDVQNPANPTYVGGFDTSGQATGVTLSSDGRYAYVGDLTAGLQIIDVQNAANPTRVGGFDTSGHAGRVTLSFDGRYAFVADGDAGLEIIDVQNPAHPTRVGGVDTSGYAKDLTLSADGRYVYFTDGYGLQIIDLMSTRPSFSLATDTVAIEWNRRPTEPVSFVAGDEGWALLLDSDSYGLSVTGQVVDAAGVTYVVGSLWGAADFDPRPDVEAILAPESEAGFIARYDASGGLLGVWEIGGGIQSIAGANGRLAIAGTFQGAGVDLDPRPDVTAAFGTEGEQAGFVVTLDSATGTPLTTTLMRVTPADGWTETSWAFPNVTLDGVLLADDGRVFVSGAVWSATVTIGSSTSIAVPLDQKDGFIVSLNASGQPTWATRLESSPDSYTPARATNLTLSGSLLATGVARSGPLGILPDDPAAAESAAVVIGLDAATGAYRWHATIAEGAVDMGDSVPVTATPDGRVHAAGHVLAGDYETGRMTTSVITVDGATGSLIGSPRSIGDLLGSSGDVLTTGLLPRADGTTVLVAKVYNAADEASRLHLLDLSPWSEGGESTVETWSAAQEGWTDGGHLTTDGRLVFQTSVYESDVFPLGADGDSLRLVSATGSASAVWSISDPFAAAVDPSITVPAGETAADTTIHTGDEQVIKRGPGTLVLDLANTHSGGTLVEEGTVVVRNPAALGSGTLDVRAGATARLDVGFATVALPRLTLAAGAILDLGEAKLTIGPGGADEATIRQWIVAGRNGGAWNGTSGIRSAAAAAASGSRSVGYIVRPDGSATVAFTVVGDLDLDRDVDVFDLLAMSTGGRYGTGGAAAWSQGDVNYDARATVIDLVGINTGGGYGRGSVITTSTLATAVLAQPEAATTATTSTPPTAGISARARSDAFATLAAGIAWDTLWNDDE